MMVPLKVRRSTIAAQRRGSVKVLVQPQNDSLEAIATAGRSSRSLSTWKSSSAPRRSSLPVEFAVSQLVEKRRSTRPQRAIVFGDVRRRGAAVVQIDDDLFNATGWLQHRPEDSLRRSED